MIILSRYHTGDRTKKAKSILSVGFGSAKIVVSVAKRKANEDIRDSLPLGLQTKAIVVLLMYAREGSTKRSQSAVSEGISKIPTVEVE